MKCIDRFILSFSTCGEVDVKINNFGARNGREFLTVGAFPPGKEPMASNG